MIGDNTKVYLVIEIKMRRVDDEKQLSLIEVLGAYEEACERVKKLKEENRNDPDFYYEYEILITTLSNILMNLK